MKTISDFKKRIKVGTKLHTIYHMTFAGRNENGVLYTDEDKGIREVSIVQSNSFALKTIKTDGSIVDSWCSYPKKSECEFIDENKIIIKNMVDNKLVPVLTYTFLE